MTYLILSLEVFEITKLLLNDINTRVSLKHRYIIGGTIPSKGFSKHLCRQRGRQQLFTTCGKTYC